MLEAGPRDGYELCPGHAELVPRMGVLALQCHARHESIVRAERDGDPGLLISVGRVVGQSRDHTGLDVGRHAHLEWNTLPAHSFEKCRVLVESSPVADATRMADIECLSDRLGAEAFARVQSDRKPRGVRSIHGLTVIGDRVAGFGAGKIEPADASSGVRDRRLCGLRGDSGRM